jgi:magnesium chelatase subunit I
MSIPEEQLINLLNDVELSRSNPEFTVSKESEESIRNNKLDTKINWLEGSQRYRYVLATPDISVKDLVGQIDAMKIAKKGVELYDIESYTSGQLLQARHGILCIDELPVLDPRKQVALLSVLQEGKFTTGSYPVVFKPDVKIIATANPIDYTHSGKIIEPLFDRLRSHIKTHYPKSNLDEMLIILQEVRITDDANVFIPIFMFKTIAKIAELARNHHDISREKGVSVRGGIHSMELLISETERTRSISQLITVVPRFCDIHSIHQSVKFELTEIEDNHENRMDVLKSIMNDAVKEISLQYIHRLTNEQLLGLRNEFANGKTFTISQTMPSHSRSNSLDYQSQLGMFPELRKVVKGMTLSIEAEQNEFAEFANKFGIKSDLVRLRNGVEGEFSAAIVEVALEGLRWVDPPVLMRKQDGYGAPF